MSPDATKTILLGVVLAILVVPLGGPAAPYGIAIVVALVLFDLWRQSVRRSKHATAEEPRTAGQTRFTATGYCSRCGTARTAGARFCPKCGLDLAQGAVGQ